MATFTGSFSDGMTAAQTAVTVTFLLDALDLRDDQGHSLARWPYQTLDYLEPPYPGRPLRLTNGKDNPARLTLADDNILADLVDRAPHLGPRRHRQVRPLGAIALGLAGLAVIIAVLLHALPWVAGQAARVIPISWEAALGDHALRQLETVLGVIGDGPPGRCTQAEGVAALESLTERLAAGDGSGYQYSVQVVDHPMVNAFAVPGGTVVLFRGLIDEARSPEVIAGILAHEFGHVTARHGTQALLRSISLAVLFDLLFEDPTGGGLSGLGLAVSNLSYSREAEREADGLALARLTQADIKASGLAEFFAGLKAGQGDTPPVFQLLSTHPSHAARQAFFEAARGRGGPAMSDQAWRALKAICDS